MASKTTLNIRNLEDLGPTRLAELLMDMVEGNTLAKRQLRQQLQLKHDPGAAARDIRKRLATIGRSGFNFNTRKFKTLEEELYRMGSFIVGDLAPVNATEGFDLLWRLYALCDLMNAYNDFFESTKSQVIPLSRDALGMLAVEAKIPPARLADKVLEHLVQRNFMFDIGLFLNLNTALGKEGFASLRDSLLSHVLKVTLDSGLVVGNPAAAENGLPVDAYTAIKQEQNSRAYSCLLHLVWIANDADAFISLIDESDRKDALFSKDISRILLEAGRPEEAWKFIEQTKGDPLSGRAIDYEWAESKIDTLVALGRGEEAQEIRLHCFKSELHEEYLRDYLENLPGFEDIDAEEKWLDYAMERSSLYEALSFLVNWPSYERANRVILASDTALYGIGERLILHTAEQMRARYPLAAVLLYRSLIEYTLDEMFGAARAAKDAQRYLEECASIDADIQDYKKFEKHEEFVARMKEEHWFEFVLWERLA